MKCISKDHEIAVTWTPAYLLLHTSSIHEYVEVHLIPRVKTPLSFQTVVTCEVRDFTNQDFACKPLLELNILPANPLLPSQRILHLRS